MAKDDEGSFVLFDDACAAAARAVEKAVVAALAAITFNAITARIPADVDDHTVRLVIGRIRKILQLIESQDSEKR
jgi:hypothetical protein